jgi:hypothetical protein
MFFQARQPVFEETLAPHADHLTAAVEASGDFFVGTAFGGEQNHPGAEHFKIRQRILGGTAAQFSLFRGREYYRVWANPWHIGDSSLSTMPYVSELFNSDIR